MTTETTIASDVLAAFNELHALFPDWRMGQLVANVMLSAGQDREGQIWEVEDEVLLAAARRLIERRTSDRQA